MSSRPLTPSKPFWQSRTLWVNTLVIIGIILVQLQAVPTIPKDWIPYLVILIPAVNMLIRMITSQSLALTRGPGPNPDPDGVSTPPGTHL